MVMIQLNPLSYNAETRTLKEQHKQKLKMFNTGRSHSTCRRTKCCRGTVRRLGWSTALQGHLVKQQQSCTMYCFQGVDQ